MKKWYFIIPALLLLIGITAGLVWYETAKNKTNKGESGTDTEALIQELMPSTVMITVGEKHASGLIYSIDEEKVILLTAGHLMQGYSQGIITFYTGNVGFANVEYISDNPDLCILSFASHYLDDSVLDILRPVKSDMTHFDNLEIDEEIYLLGSAMSTGSNATVGRVASKDFYVDDFDARMLYLYSNVMAGMSGCGIYDSEGYLLGTLAGGTDDGEAVAVPLPQIYEKLEEIENDKN